MRLHTGLLLCGIFASVHSFITSISKGNDRSVNVALETVLEFSNKDKEGDIKFLDNVQNFISKVKMMIDKNGSGNKIRRHFVAPRGETFTGFIQDVVNILNTYDDNALENFFHIFDQEIRNYHYRGCRFYELMENYEIRNLIAEKLDLIKGKPAPFTKVYINEFSNMLRDEKYDIDVEEIVDYINSLYGKDVKDKFQKVLSDLEAYGRAKPKARSNNNLGKLIRNGVRSVIFDYYTNLHPNARRDLKQKIEKFWRRFTKSQLLTGHIPNFKARNKVKVTENSKNEVEKPERISKKDRIYTNNKKTPKNIKVKKMLRNTPVRAEKTKSTYKNPGMKRHDKRNNTKRYRDATKDTIAGPLEMLEKEARQINSQHTTHTGRQKTTDQHKKQSSSIDSLSNESFDSKESIKNKDKSHKYMAIIPENTYVPKKPVITKVLNVATKVRKNKTVKTIWIEASTGRLPKSVLDKLAMKPGEQQLNYNSTDKYFKKHKNEHDKSKKRWHGKIYEQKLKKFDKEYKMKSLSKHQKAKNDNKFKYNKNSKQKEPSNLKQNRDSLRQNYVRTTKSVFDIEEHEHQKSTGSLGSELKHDKKSRRGTKKPSDILEVSDIKLRSQSAEENKPPLARRTDLTKKAPDLSKLSRVQLLDVIKPIQPTKMTSPSPATNYSMGLLDSSTPISSYSTTIKILPEKLEKHVDKYEEHTLSFNNGMTVDKNKIKEDDKFRQEPSIKLSSLDDLYVTKKLNKLEKQFNAVSIKMNSTDTEKAEKGFKHRFVIKGDIKNDSQQSENQILSDTNKFVKEFKLLKDDLNLTETEYNKTRLLTKQVKDKDSKNNVNSMETGKMSNIVFRTNENDDSELRTANTKLTGSANHGNEYEMKSIKLKYLKEHEAVVDHDDQTMKVTQQQENIKENKKTVIKHTNINNATKAVEVAIEDHGFVQKYFDDHAAKDKGIKNKEITSTSTVTKATESTIKSTLTIKPAMIVTTPITLKLSTTPVTPVVTSLRSVILKKAELNAKENRNKMSTNKLLVADNVSKTTIKVGKIG